MIQPAMLWSASRNVQLRSKVRRTAYVAAFVLTAVHTCLALQIGELTSLVTLELEATNLQEGLIDCPGALVTGISSLHSTLRHLGLMPAALSGSWLADSLRQLSALQALRLQPGFSDHSEGLEAGQNVLDGALQAVPQLTGLMLEGGMPGPPPPAIGAMSQLQWLCLDCYWDIRFRLPAGA